MYHEDNKKRDLMAPHSTHILNKRNEQMKKIISQVGTQGQNNVLKNELIDEIYTMDALDKYTRNNLKVPDKLQYKF